MIRYYDVVLGLIPASLLGISVFLYIMGASFTTAVPIASLVAAGVIGHALFVRSPVSPPPRSPHPE